MRLRMNEVCRALGEISDRAASFLLTLFWSAQAWLAHSKDVKREGANDARYQHNESQLALFAEGRDGTEISRLGHPCGDALVGGRTARRAQAANHPRL